MKCLVAQNVRQLICLFECSIFGFALNVYVSRQGNVATGNLILYKKSWEKQYANDG
jgi:hypothetical protein